MLVYYFVLFVVSNRYLLFWVSNGHNSVTVQNQTHVYMNFFDHKDLGNHLLQLCPKIVKHPVYIRCAFVGLYNKRYKMHCTNIKIFLYPIQPSPLTEENLNILSIRIPSWPTVQMSNLQTTLLSSLWILSPWRWRQYASLQHWNI